MLRSVLHFIIFFITNPKKVTKVDPRLGRGCSGDHRQGLPTTAGVARIIQRSFARTLDRVPGRWSIGPRLPQLRDKSWSRVSDHVLTSPGPGPLSGLLPIVLCGCYYERCLCQCLPIANCLLPIFL